MLNSPVLNVVIGITFVYLLYSLLATIIKEGIASTLGLRAKMLEQAIKRMLEDNITQASTTQKLSAAFFENPGIKYMSESKKGKPSYLEPSVFSKSLIDVLKKGGEGANTLLQISNAIENTKVSIDPETKDYIKSLIKDANNDIDKFKASLEDWFNNMMDRASGWYKRQVQLILLVIGLVVALIFNVDTLGIVNKLSKDKNAADRLASMATAYINNPDKAKALDILSKGKGDTGIFAYNQLKDFNTKNQKDISDANQVLALGWDFPIKPHCILPDICSTFKNKAGRIPIKLLGFLLTALAISMGAPFWFDLLSKIINIRGTGAKPDDSQPSGSTKKAPNVG